MIKGKQERHPIVSVKNLTKKYGKKTVVKGINFEVYEGEIFGILVPNGAAPSKVLEVSRGLLRLAGTVGVLLFVSAVLVGYATMSRRLDLSRTAALEAENARLVREIGDLSGKLDHLSDTIAQISRRDARIRVLANLFGGQGTINVNSWAPDSRRFAFVSYELLP